MCFTRPRAVSGTSLVVVHPPPGPFDGKDAGSISARALDGPGITESDQALVSGSLQSRLKMVNQVVLIDWLG